jgi:phage baseplate assembly protein W
MPIVGTSQTIVQLSPVADSTTVLDSAEYTNQLNAVGGLSAIDYSTTNSSPAFTVSSTGQINATGALSVGTYSASGTTMDQNGSTGVWAFTLTVIGNASPQTSVQPSQAPAPQGIEMLVPFQIDPATGGVAFLSDYNKILAQHILTIIMTGPDERVMNPTYGFGLGDMVFGPVASLTVATTADDIKNQIAKWEPAVSVSQVAISQSPNNPALVIVTVTYSVVPFTDMNQVSVAVGGGVVQVISV